MDLRGPSMKVVSGTVQRVARKVGRELLLPVDIDQFQREGAS